MMGAARSPAMQAAYDRAVARESGAWDAEELKAQLVAVVNAAAAEQPEVSALDVALALLRQELDAFVLFARMGHLDPPREDGKVPIAILQRRCTDPEIDAKIRDTAKQWAIEQEAKS